MKTYQVNSENDLVVAGVNYVNGALLEANPSDTEIADLVFRNKLITPTADANKAEAVEAEEEIAKDEAEEKPSVDDNQSNEVNSEEVL